MSVSFPVSPTRAQVEELASMRGHWRLFFFLGLVAMLLGGLAIAAPHLATEKAVVFLGILLLVAGITEVIHVVMGRNLRGFAMHLLAAALYLIVGVFVLEDPSRAAAVLTLLVTAAFLVGGVLRILFSLLERFPAWPWVLFHGLIDVVLGFLIWRGWPESTLWVIGLFVGIELFVHGLSWVMLALTVRTPAPAPAV